MSEEEKQPELVMCVHQAAFKQLSESIDKSTAIMLLYGMPGCTMMLDRNIVENEPRLLQLITYTIISSEGKYLVYRRGKSGGEERLHSLYSIGIGGHVNMEDVCNAMGRTAKTGSATDPIWQCMVRELREELNMPDEMKISMTALPAIYDDSSDVSKVHIGVSSIINMEKQDMVTPKEDCIEDMQWLTLEELQSDVWKSKLESWSNIAVVHIQAKEAEKNVQLPEE